MTLTSSTGSGLRPTRLLPWRQLALISLYWFGISAIWGGYEQFGQKQVELIVGQDSRGVNIAILELLGALVAIVVQPTVGVISDYTTSRFGKRKGYIIGGASFDLLFLTGLAVVAMPQPDGWGADGHGPALGSFGLMAAYSLFFLLLQASSNVAQGPFQGYVPDLVAEPQVGTASGAVGVMRVTGLVAGAFIMLSVGKYLNLWGLALLIIGLLEFSMAAATFLRVSNGPPGRPREGRAWRSIAMEAWGTDVLRERSFLLTTTVRLLFLIGTGIFVNVSVYYIEDSQGQLDDFWGTFWWGAALVTVLLGTVVAALPAARISNRTGRKPVIWVAAMVAGIGLVIIAIAPTPMLAMPGLLLMGVGSGAYLAVDWALMTEVIPLAASGRYMGLANIANSISGPIGLIVGGPIMDALTRAGHIDIGPRVAIGLGVFALAGASLVLTGVHPRRDPRTATLEARAAAV
jgi:MFS family permease